MFVSYSYRAVVGPCGRGGGWGAAGGSGGGAGGALLAADRPRHATFAAIVRDAIARLPNGEGTRHDVLTLLKYVPTTHPLTHNPPRALNKPK